MDKFSIYLKPTSIGTRLSLGPENVKDKNFVKWAVEDDFNGSSLPTSIYSEEAMDGRIGDFIYGFYRVGDIVTLKLYNKNGTIKEQMNVIIQEGGSI